MYCSTLSLTSALDGSVWPMPRLGRFTPAKDTVPTVYEAGWAAGPVWTGVENLTLTGTRSTDQPARSESLYRLSYTSSQIYPVGAAGLQVRNRTKHLPDTKQNRHVRSNRK